MSRAVAVIVRNGRRTRPATSHPSPIETTAIIGEGDTGLDEELVHLVGVLLGGEGPGLFDLGGGRRSASAAGPATLDVAVRCPADGWGRFFARLDDDGGTVGKRRRWRRASVARSTRA